MAEKADFQARPCLATMRTSGSVYGTCLSVGSTPQVIEPVVRRRRAVGEREERAVMEEHQQRDDGAARPAGERVDVHRAGRRKQHQLGGERRDRVPGEETEEREVDAGEDAHLLETAAGEDELLRLQHPRIGRLDAEQPQRQVALAGGREIARQPEGDSPAPVDRLVIEQVADEPRLARHRQLETERLPHEHVLGGDGAVRLELGAPVAVALLRRVRVVHRSADRLGGPECERRHGLLARP